MLICRTWPAVYLFLAGALLASTLEAQTATLSATADTYLRQSSANQNQGQDVLLRVQQSGHNRVLVAMDSAAITAAVGSGSLASATLELYVTSTSGWGSAGRTVDIHRLTTGWTENGATWNCAIDLIPTNSQPNCTTQWEGGTFDDEASDSVLHLNTTSGFVQWNVTDDVRAFLAGTPNYGWLAKLSDETLPGNVDYTSRQGSATAQRPRLVLVVESPSFDQVPPSISITAPAHAFVINEPTPEIRIEYADHGSGIAPATLGVTVDGIAATCVTSASGATCRPVALAEGNHAIAASVRDQAGNQATATRSFMLLIGPGLRSATFATTADTTLKKSSANQNFGGDTTLRLRQSGKNRSLVRFDTAEIAQVIGQGTLRSASLELSVGTSSGWGTTGRTVDAHRLTADWTEAAATWNCAIDTIPTNSQPNCTTQWAGGTFQATPSSTVLHTNGQTGRVGFDVTPDVAALLAGNPAYGWLVKKTDETQSGKADYAAREAGAASAPQLVIFFDVPASGDTTPPTIAITAPAVVIYNQATPEVRVDYSDAGSGVNPSTLVVRLDGAILDCQTTLTSASCASIFLSPGSHSMAADLQDFAANSSHGSIVFSIVEDREAPALILRTPNRAEYFPEEAPAIEGDFADAGSGLDPASFHLRFDGLDLAGSCASTGTGFSCPSPSIGEGPHSLGVSIADLAGNEATAEAGYSIVVDDRGPSLAITEPNGTVRGATRPRIVVEFSDDRSGVAPATFHLALDGEDRTASCELFATGAECLPESVNQGVHLIEAQLADQRGNASRALASFELSLSLDLAITLPLGGTIVREPTVRLEGTVSAEATSVSVSGIPAQVSAGSWVLPAMPIREGGNTLTVVARSPEGGVGTATVAVIRDSEAPRVAILTPRDGFVTSASQIVVSGDLVDSVSTSSKQRALKVLVNEHEATVERKSFVLTDLLLLPGENRIEVTAEDEAGNVGRSSITVRFVPDAVARIEEISGNFQEAAIRDTLSQPLVVRIVDFLGRPLAGRTVDFAVTRGDGSLLSFPDAARKLSGVTNEEGLAAMRFALGTRAGAGNQEVTVSSVGIPGSVLFCATARPKPAKQVHPIAATDFQGAKTGPAGQPLPKPLFIQVFDGFGNPVAGQEVIFRSVEGGGTFAGAPEARLTTDDEGKAGAVFTLGPEEGINNNRVEVNFEGGTESPAVFIVSGLIPGPAELTALAGIVLDPSDAPVPGARIHVGSIETRTDAEGRFRLDGLPVGTVHVEIDGSTVTRPGTWPPLGYELVLISGRVNELGKPMRLPQIDDAGKKRVGGDQDVTIPIHGVAGAMLTVFAHSVTFPDGSHEGDVAFTQVPAQKVPMVAPQNAGFMLAWTVQPAGVHFDPPARVSIPNFGAPGGGGNPPGLTGEIFSFDHDLGEFVSAGTASITEDGRMMMSNPGMGISKAGWGGCPHPPAPPAEACGKGDGTCKICPAEGGPSVSKCDTCSQCDGTGGGCQPRSIDEYQILIEPEPDETTAAQTVAPNAGPAPTLRLEIHQEATFDPSKLTTIGPKCTDLKFHWSFGDGTTSDLEKPKHHYKKKGSYPVTVRIDCNNCPSIAGKTFPETIKVEGKITLDKVISAQLGSSADCNRLPPYPGVSTAKNNPMIMGANSGTTSRVDFDATISSRPARDVTYFAARRTGSTNLIKSVAAASSGLTRLEWNAEDGENDYEFVAGFDENENHKLDPDEIEQTFPQHAKIVTAADYAENIDDVNRLRLGFPIGGVARETLAYFLDLEPSVPQSTSLGIDSVTPTQLDHPLGVRWSPGCSASVLAFNFAPSSAPSHKFAAANNTFAAAWSAFSAAKLVAIKAAMAPLGVTAEMDFSGPVSFSRTFSAGSWLPREPDISLAFGGLTVHGTVARTRFKKVFSNVIQLIELEYSGNFRDVYDFNYFVTGTQGASLVESGYPTLGNAGRVFVDNVEFDETLTVSQFAHTTIVVP